MFLTASITCLVVAIVAYGTAPILLARHGDQPSGNPLADRAWWLGTASQAVGFVASFVARHALPLVIVQPALTSSLAYTAVLEGRSRHKRHGRGLFTAVSALCLGLAVLGISAHTGLAPRPNTVLVVCLILASLLAVGGLLPRIAPRTTMRMVLAGFAFSVVAILSRTLAADPIQIVTQLKTTGLTVWMVGAAVLGQLLQTDALRRAGGLIGPLAAMWLVETIVPSIVGLVSGVDHIRSGSWPFVGLAVIVSAGAAVTLAGQQFDEMAGVTDPSTPHPNRPAKTRKGVR